MQQNIKISSRQAILICTTLVIATGWLSSPAFVAEKAQHDAWISIIVASLLSLPVVWIISKLSSLYPGKTFIEYIEEILSVWPGKVLAFFYLLWFIHITSIMYREYSDFITDAFMPETPLIVFPVTSTFVIAYAVTKGLEVIARTVEIFFPLIIFSVVAIFIFLIPNMDADRILPIFEADAISIFKGALIPMGWMMEIFTFAMLIPFLNKPRQSLKIALISTGITGLNFLISVTGSLLVFGGIIGAMTYPVLNAARLISISEFLQRPEPIIMAIWVAGGLLKISIFYFVIVFGLAQWLKLKDYRPLVLPVGAILTALSMNVAENNIKIAIFLSNVWPIYAFLFQFAIPALLLITALVKNKLAPKK